MLGIPWESWPMVLVLKHWSTPYITWQTSSGLTIQTCVCPSVSSVDFKSRVRNGLSSTLCHLWFAFFCGFSAQTLYDPYFVSFYNVFYTSIPVLILACFDQVSNQNMLHILNALFLMHSLVIGCLSIVNFKDMDISLTKLN